MKKNRMMRIAAFLLVAALLSICVVSGTYAKYTSTISGSDSARVAKWDIKVGGTTANSQATFTFDLFKAFGRDPTTSPSPPVLAKGSTSEETIKTLVLTFLISILLY